jgi:uncharacterized protein YfkK (UPF0435 family)
VLETLKNIKALNYKHFDVKEVIKFKICLLDFKEKYYYFNNTGFNQSLKHYNFFMSVALGPFNEYKYDNIIKVYHNISEIIDNLTEQNIYSMLDYDYIINISAFLPNSSLERFLETVDKAIIEYEMYFEALYDHSLKKKFLKQHKGVLFEYTNDKNNFKIAEKTKKGLNIINIGFTNFEMYTNKKYIEITTQYDVDDNKSYTKIIKHFYPEYFL